MPIDNLTEISGVPNKFKHNGTYFKYAHSALQSYLNTLLTSSNDHQRLICVLSGMGLFNIGKSIWLLSFLGHSIEAHILSRTFIETAVNSIYSAADGNQATRALFYFLHRRRKSMVKEFKTASGTMSLFNPNHLKIPLSEWEKDARKAFRNKKHKQKHAWTDLTVEERIEFARSKFGARSLTSTEMAFRLIYQEASEVAHGSMYGMLFPLGLASYDKVPHESWVNQRDEQLDILLLLLGGVMLDFIRCHSNLYPCGNLPQIESESIKIITLDEQLGDSAP